MSEIESILDEIRRVLGRVPDEEIQGFAEDLLAAERVFAVGEGRSGLMARAFAMRLMHLGARVFVVGETITPAIESGDTLVAISGSGTTASVRLVADRAREVGARLLVVTTDPASPLAEAASRVLHLPAATKYRREGEPPTVQPLGSLFDQCAHLAFDAVCLRYAREREAGHRATLARHSNLE